MSVAGGGDEQFPRPALTAQAPMQVPKPLVNLPQGRSANPVESGESKTWNTSNLGFRLGADASAAASASILVSPLICVIDRSIVEKASSGAPLSACLRNSLYPALTRPHTFLASKPFFLIFSLYFSTYFTANSIDTLTTTIQSKPASKVTTGPAKFIATSAVNMSMCVYKDSYFAKVFATSSSASPASKMPKITYALFALRDSMTIFASFNLPPLIAPQLANLPPSIKKQFSRVLSTEAGRSNTAQFIAPAAMQLISTPIHLLGLDLFNRQGRMGFGERFAKVSRDWGVCALARMGRIVPAFGVGGVVNANVRKNFMGKLE